MNIFEIWCWRKYPFHDVDCSVEAVTINVRPPFHNHEGRERPGKLYDTCVMVNSEEDPFARIFKKLFVTYSSNSPNVLATGLQEILNEFFSSSFT